MRTSKKTFYSVNCVENNHLEEKRITFGLDVFTEDVKQFSVNDIAFSKEFVEELANLFNRQELCPIHLYDVLSDVLP